MTAPIHLSLTEIETLAAKAARGAGLSWGMAEEAGFATRWLSAHGLAGPSHLLAHLTRNDGAEWRDVAPAIHDRVWASATGGALCPLATGAALCDAASLPAGPGTGPLGLQKLGFPVLLLPFLAGASVALSQPLALMWQTGRAVLSGDADLWIEAETGWEEATMDVTVSTIALPQTAALRAAVQPIPATALQALNALALRTTVPASARSRAGAGAATTDND